MCFLVEAFGLNYDTGFKSLNVVSFFSFSPCGLSLDDCCMEELEGSGASMLADCWTPVPSPQSPVSSVSSPSWLRE